MSENSVLIENYLNRVPYKEWKENKGVVEFILSPDCDHACKYCYFNRHKDLFPNGANYKTILENLRKTIDWFHKMEFNPKEVEVFSGEIFSTPEGFESVEMILASFPLSTVVVPTNMSFIFDDEKIKKVEGLFSKGKLILSASVDGKYMEENRPIIDGRIRDDEYYDKLFKFASKYNIGFHPMVYSNGIERWKDNFLWFQEMFIKYGIDWKRNLYLLEVRNKEWTQPQIREFSKFVEFVFDWSWNKVNDKKEFMKIFKKESFFNIINICKTGRGLPCGLQMGPKIRIFDMKVFPCHRTMYDAHELYQFTEDFHVSDKCNPELMFATLFGES